MKRKTEDGLKNQIKSSLPSLITTSEYIQPLYLSFLVKEVPFQIYTDC